MKKKLAVFDMDGTLFDTAEVNYYSYAKAAEELGYTIEKEHFLAVFTGKNYREFLPVFGITENTELNQIHEIKKELYPQYLSKVRKNSALFDLIESIKSDYTIALATTASKKNVSDILCYFDVEKLFDFIITQEDTVKLKPDPECYILAMKRAGIEPENTIIFEDSDVGLRAAEASGGYPIKVAVKSYT